MIENDVDFFAQTKGSVPIYLVCHCPHGIQDFDAVGGFGQNPMGSMIEGGILLSAELAGNQSEDACVGYLLAQVGDALQVFKAGNFDRVKDQVRGQF